jgi:hypothetical protein
MPVDATGSWQTEKNQRKVLALLATWLPLRMMESIFVEDDELACAKGDGFLEFSTMIYVHYYRWSEEIAPDCPREQAQSNAFLSCVFLLVLSN